LLYKGGCYIASKSKNESKNTVSFEAIESPIKGSKTESAYSIFKKSIDIASKNKVSIKLESSIANTSRQVS
jgi:hypothetical protein